MKEKTENDFFMKIKPAKLWVDKDIMTAMNPNGKSFACIHKSPFIATNSLGQVSMQQINCDSSCPFFIVQNENEATLNCCTQTIRLINIDTENRA